MTSDHDVQLGSHAEPIVVIAEDVPFLTHRRTQIALLSRALRKPVLVMSLSRERSKLVEASLLAWYLKSEGVVTELVVAAQAGGQGLRLADRLAAYKPSMVVLAGHSDNPIWQCHGLSVRELTSRASTPFLFLDSPSEEILPFDGVVAACDTRTGNAVSVQSAQLASAMDCELKLVEVLDSARLAQNNHARRNGVRRMEAAVDAAEEALAERARKLDIRLATRTPDVEVRVGDVARELNTVSQDFGNPLVVVRDEVTRPRWRGLAIDDVEGSIVTVPPKRLC